jgi:hypothetical protein
MYHSRQLLALAIALALSPAMAAPDRSEFEKWMQQETTSFKEYRDKRDQEFTSFLKTQWKEMQTFKGEVRDDTPKPKVMPVAPTLPPVSSVPEQPVAVAPPIPPAGVKPEPAPARPSVTPPVPVLPVIKPEEKQPEIATPAPAVPVVTVPPIATLPEPVKVAPVAIATLPKGQKLDVTFYGQHLRFSYDPALKVNLGKPIDGKAISDYWSALSLADYEPLLKQLEAQRTPLQLNDWGYALLTYTVAQGIFPNRSNEQALFSWFVMTKAGFRARIAYDNARVYLLMPAQQQVFAAAYFTFDNQRYYALGLDGNKYKLDRVFTYDGNYPGASKSLDMRMDKSLNTGRQDKVKLVNFSYNGSKYQVKLDTDNATIAYLKTYPQLDINLYFSADVNRATANPLLLQLKPMVQGKSEKDAVNLLLRFVQTAFPYETDEQQFGSENYLFPEETLYYPYSDCEDRSVLFAWLVRNLIGLEVVGLDYPGHVATAVRFNEDVKGDSISYNGKRYVISDPTYINANAGMTMPDFRKVQPKVIVF